jgi:hypothetical protein
VDGRPDFPAAGGVAAEIAVMKTAMQDHILETVRRISIALGMTRNDKFVP